MSQQASEAPPFHEERTAMTYEEWLVWAEGIKFVPPDPDHGFASGFLFRLLADFVELFNLGAVR